MKKIKIIATAIFIILLIGKKTYAASAYTDQEIGARIKEIVAQDQSVNNDYSVNYYDYLGRNLNEGNNSDTFSLITFRTDDGYTTAAIGILIDCTSTSFTFTGNYIYVTTFRRSDWYTNTWNVGTYDGLINVVDHGTMRTWMENIDYNNYVYDPSIYVPNIKAVFTGNNPSQAASTYSIPVDFTIDNGTGIEYGVQIQYKFWMPKLVKFIYSDGGSVNYAYANYSGHFNELYEMGSGETISAAEDGEKAYLSFNLMDNINDWVNFHSSVMLTQTYESNVTDYSSAQSAYSRFNKNALKMGNRLELWVRYYYVADGVAYAGDWRHWISEAPQEQDLVQSVQYVTGSNVSANSNQVNPSEQEIAQELESPTSVLPSYQNVQVTVINQVPNNMNYPTISSYQNDNMLVDTMNNATKIMNWLNGEGEFSQAGMTGASNGGFGAFLGASFGFIPWYIWAVIAVGFGFSIVIMILKVL